MATYNKLVRDKIPHIISLTGKSCRTKVLDNKQYAEELNMKLKEEMNEYFNANDAVHALEELADVLEVIRALAAVNGLTWDELEALRDKKTEQRGGFQKQIYLVEVNDQA